MQGAVPAHPDCDTIQQLARHISTIEVQKRVAAVADYVQSRTTSASLSTYKLHKERWSYAAYDTQLCKLWRAAALQSVIYRAVRNILKGPGRVFQFSRGVKLHRSIFNLQRCWHLTTQVGLSSKKSLFS